LRVSLQERLFMVVGVAMAIGLFVIASEPNAGRLFHGRWHHVAHFATFALLGGIWTLALPRVPVRHIAAGAVAFGFLHEGLEILGHLHAFELRDAVVNGAGAIVGATCGWLVLRRA
jgi:VanZ family protein